MRLALLTVFALSATAGVAWLIPEGAPTPPDADGRSSALLPGRAARPRDEGALLRGRGGGDALPPPSTSNDPILGPRVGATTDAAATGPRERPKPFNGVVTGREIPRAPATVERAELGDRELIPVVTRDVFLSAPGGHAIAAGGSRAAARIAPWRVPPGGEAFGGEDATIVSLARDEEEAQAREEEPDPVETAVVGVVVDAAGQPIAGARVVVYSAFYERTLAYGHRIREVGSVTSDLEGRFNLRPIALDTVHFGSNGEVVLSISSPAHGDIVTKRMPNIEPEIENDLGQFMLRESMCTLQGQLVDREGKPVEGAVVRVSGSLQPTLYDKQERMVFLRHCPTATTDAEGRYQLAGFAPDTHFISIHVNIDSPWTEPRTLPVGTTTLDLTIRAGGSVRGMVINEEGDPIDGAIVAGGENYTHTLPDGTFWLDNVTAGVFSVWVAHHEYKSVIVQDVSSQTEHLVVELLQPLPRLALRVSQGEANDPVPVIAVQWQFPKGQPPNPAVPTSPFWHSPAGTFEIPIPERAIEVTISADELVPRVVAVEPAPEDEQEVHLEAPPPPPAEDEPGDE